jgi:hypothetical protein
MADEPGSVPATGNPAPAAGAGQPTSWTEGLPDDLKGLALNKGWDAPQKALESYRQLEQFMGADKAGRGVVLPGENATPEEIKAFHAKLGVPSTPDAYELAVPADFPDQTFAATASALYLKHSIPKANAQAMTADIMKMVGEGHAAEAAADQQRFAAEEAALKDGWGDKFDQNIEIAKRGAAKLGFTTEIIDQMETKAGFAGVIKALHQAGVMLGEGKFVDGGGAGGGPAGNETLEQLQLRRTALAKDKAWAQRYHANEPAARREYDELNQKIAALVGA